MATGSRLTSGGRAGMPAQLRTVPTSAAGSSSCGSGGASGRMSRVLMGVRLGGRGRGMGAPGTTDCPAYLLARKTARRVLIRRENLTNRHFRNIPFNLTPRNSQLEFGTLTSVGRRSLEVGAVADPDLGRGPGGPKKNWRASGVLPVSPVRGNPPPAHEARGGTTGKGPPRERPAGRPRPRS